MKKRARLAAGGGAVAVALAVVGGIVGLSVHGSTPAPTPTSSPVARSTPSPIVVTPPPDVPAAPSAATLAALPLAYYDAVIPGLLDGTSVSPVVQWSIATPDAPLVALYASPAADAAPIATLGSTVPTINRPVATAVWGRSAGADGGMILVSTPSRNRTPGDGGVASAPSATFAWARAADFTITPTDRMIRVDNATGTVEIVGQDGSVSASETARLGTPEDPTPAATSTYLEADYVDPNVTYTEGHPIALTGAHSALVPSFGGNSALTALHFYPDATGSSHGCVRVSAAMTAALATLPVGTAIQFT